MRQQQVISIRFYGLIRDDVRDAIVDHLSDIIDVFEPGVDWDMEGQIETVEPNDTETP